MCSENHAIDWDSVNVIDREMDKTATLIREALWIRRSSNMNKDQGSYQLRSTTVYLLTSETISQS